MACTSAATSLTGVPRVDVNAAGLDGQPGAVNVGHATYPFSGLTAGDWACGAGPEECDSSWPGVPVRWTRARLARVPDRVRLAGGYWRCTGRSARATRSHRLPGASP